MRHCLVFASLISPSKMILFERRIFNSLLGVSSGDETLHLMFDILLQAYERVRYGFHLLEYVER